MFTTYLFLGLEVTPAIIDLIASGNPSTFKIFVKNDDVYLHDFNYEGRRYLGKFAGSQTRLSDLQILEDNILSLLMKVFETNPSNFSLQLFPVIDNSHARKRME